MRININIAASHPSLAHVTMLLHVTDGWDGDDHSDDIFEARGGKWRKVNTLTYMEDIFRELPLSISKTLQNTVIIELNYYFLCQ